MLKPDYKASIGQVYITFARAVLEAGGMEQLLFTACMHSHAPENRRAQLLPTWVPDWRNGIRDEATQHELKFAIRSVPQRERDWEIVSKTYLKLTGWLLICRDRETGRCYCKLCSFIRTMTPGKSLSLAKKTELDQAKKNLDSKISVLCPEHDGQRTGCSTASP